jgi:hypothetical protein
MFPTGLLWLVTFPLTTMDLDCPNKLLTHPRKKNVIMKNNLGIMSLIYFYDAQCKSKVGDETLKLRL